MNAINPRIVLPQLSLVRDAAGPRILGRSAEIPFEIEEQALALVLRFGPRTSPTPTPSGTVLQKSRDGKAFFLASFAECPGAESSLAFRFTVFPAKLRPFIDPFAFALRFPAEAGKGDLPTLEWEPVAPPVRTVESVRDLLKSGDSPLLLGTTQALLDGCKIAIAANEANEAATDFVRQVWQLLPDMARLETTFATFARSVELNVDLAVIAEGVPIPKGFLTAEQARDYPESRYELSLQLAAETGNQAKLDQLFARKTSNQVLRMVITMIVFAFVAIVLIRLI